MAWKHISTHRHAHTSTRDYTDISKILICVRFPLDTDLLHCIEFTVVRASVQEEQVTIEIMFGLKTERLV